MAAFCARVRVDAQTPAKRVRWGWAPGSNSGEKATAPTTQKRQGAKNDADGEEKADPTMTGDAVMMADSDGDLDWEKECELDDV
jgi:hypothetical protein